MEQLRAYQQLLAGEGVEWGLIGPREVPRLWDRHIDNCLAVTEDQECLPVGSSVIDVGSGAGLPGLVWAIARPDLQITLVEPLERRVRFLDKAIEDLSLEVDVIRDRAQNVKLRADRVTARALAKTATAFEWLAPLTTPDGRLVLLKGQRAQEELEQAQGWLTKHCWSARVCDVGDPPRTRVVIAQRDPKG